MTGKYIQFEHGDSIINTKSSFMERTGIPKRVLERLKGSNKEGIINWNGVPWKFKTVYKTLQERSYTPNPKGNWGKSTITTKVLGRLELTYRGDTLIKTRSLS